MKTKKPLTIPEMLLKIKTYQIDISLYAIKCLAEDMNGSIQLNFIPYQGYKYVLYLPLEIISELDNLPFEAHEAGSAGDD